MRTSNARKITMAVTLLLSCEPQNIAPLPSPAEPDGTRILLSSLTAGESDDSELNRLISVVGVPGAVDDAGSVEITNTRTGAIAIASATSTGTFAGKSYGQSGDTLELIYVDESGYRSAATSLDVSAYVPAQVSESAPNGASATPQPSPPGEDFETGGGKDSAINCPDEEEPCAIAETDGSATDEIGWVVSYANGTVTLQGPIGFAEPGSIIVVSNLNTGQVVTAVVAQDSGAVRIDIEAENGHTLLVFAQDATDASLTSPAEEYLLDFGDQ